MKYDPSIGQFILSTGTIIDSVETYIPTGGGSFVEIYQEGKLTPEERKEIAEYMCELWKEWAK